MHFFFLRRKISHSATARFLILDQLRVNVLKPDPRSPAHHTTNSSETADRRTSYTSSYTAITIITQSILGKPESMVAHSYTLLTSAAARGKSEAMTSRTVSCRLSCPAIHKQPTSSVSETYRLNTRTRRTRS